MQTWCMVHGTGQAAVRETCQAPCSSAVRQVYREVPAKRQLRSGLRLPDRRSDAVFPRQFIRRGEGVGSKAEPHDDSVPVTVLL